MSLVLEPKIYSPSIAGDGSYVDNLAGLSFTNCVRCACSNKDKTFNTKAKFKGHTTTRMHINWITELNNNRENHLVDSTRLTDTVKNQKIIIARLEIEALEKSATIVCLSREIAKLTVVNNEVSVDLMDFD
jgi:hypothetical protein